MHFRFSTKVSGVLPVTPAGGPFWRRIYKVIGLSVRIHYEGTALVPDHSHLARRFVWNGGFSPGTCDHPKFTNKLKRSQYELAPATLGLRYLHPRP